MEKTKELVELCDQIKAKLEEQGREHLLVRANKHIDEVDIDIENCEFDDEEDIYNDWGLLEETRLVSFDCGGYCRDLRLDGLFVENGVLKFHLTEAEESFDGGGNEIDAYEKDLDGLLEDGCWWLVGDPAVEFRHEAVLKFYLDLLTGDFGITLPPFGELKERRMGN